MCQGIKASFQPSTCLVFVLIESRKLYTVIEKKSVRGQKTMTYDSLKARNFFLLVLFLLFLFKFKGQNKVTVKTVHACPQTSKLWSGTSKLRNETLNWNFETPSWNFKKFSNLPWKLYFQIWCYYLVYKANHKVCWKKVSRKIRKILWSCRLEFRSFNFKFHLSTSKIPIRFSKLGARSNRFDYN